MSTIGLPIFIQNNHRQLLTLIVLIRFNRLLSRDILKYYIGIRNVKPTKSLKIIKVHICCLLLIHIIFIMVTYKGIEKIK